MREKTSNRKVGQKLLPEEAKAVKDMLKAGYAAAVIARELHIGRSTIQRIKTQEGYIGEHQQKTLEEIVAEDEDKRRWLDKHWNFIKPVPERKKGVVQRGYRSNFRTPQRPDGVWK